LSLVGIDVGPSELPHLVDLHAQPDLFDKSPIQKPLHAGLI